MSTISDQDQASRTGSTVQAVKGKCSVPFPLEGRKVDGAKIDQAHPLGGLSAQPLDPTTRSNFSGLPGASGHLHEWEFKGSAGADDVLDCDQPSVLRCRTCADTWAVRCRATRDDRCKPCAGRHRKDVARVLRSGFDGDRPEGYWLLTLTAPGAAGGLPFDETLCTHAAGVKCSGKAHGCTAERFAMGAWNETAPQRWSWFMTDLRRVLKVDIQYGASWECQCRGALHRHAVMRAPGVTARRFKAAVKLCAGRWGFSNDYRTGLDCDPISGHDAKEFDRSCWYISKYATKGGKLAESLDVMTGELHEGGYRRSSTSRRWGLTLRAVRQERVQWASANAAGAAGGHTAAAVTAAGAEGVGFNYEQETYASGVLLMWLLGGC